MTSDNATLGRSAITWTLRAITCSLYVVSIVMLPWWLGLLLSILVEVCLTLLNVYLTVAVSDESFEKIGSVIGSGLGAVRNLFSRKAA